MPTRVRRARFAILPLLWSLFPAPAGAGNGDPVDGHPNYRERAMLALTNACRQGPQQYRDRYLPAARILRPGAYPAVPPLYFSAPLNRSARAHSSDMSRTPCFQHDSCDGTSLWTRIQRYYKSGTSMGENIAMGYRTPLDAVNDLLFDGGAADHSQGDGHRRNIMAAKYSEMGNGSVTGGARGPCDTQDFGNGRPAFTTPLVSGSHLVGGDGTVTFLASYHSSDGEAADEATIEVEGRSEDMALAFGTRKNGTWRLILQEADACRRYRFLFRDDDGRTWFHPEGGNLFTTGEGGCRREYEAVPGALSSREDPRRTD